MYDSHVRFGKLSLPSMLSITLLTWTQKHVHSRFYFHPREIGGLILIQPQGSLGERSFFIQWNSPSVSHPLCQWFSNSAGVWELGGRGRHGDGGLWLQHRRHPASFKHSGRRTDYATSGWSWRPSMSLPSFTVDSDLQWQPAMRLLQDLHSHIIFNVPFIFFNKKPNTVQICGPLQTFSTTAN